MAQKRKRNKSKKWIFWLMMLALLAVAAVVAYLVWDSYFKNKASEGSVGPQEVERVEVKEEEGLDEGGEIAEEEEVTEGDKKVPQYDGEDPNEMDEVSGVVTYAGVNGDKLMIRVNIDQFLDGGECMLSLVQGGAVVYSDIANVVGSATTSTCEGFDVLKSQIGSGATEIKITVNAGEKAGVISGKVEL